MAMYPVNISIETVYRFTQQTMYIHHSMHSTNIYFIIADSSQMYNVLDMVTCGSLSFGYSVQWMVISSGCWTRSETTPLQQWVVFVGDPVLNTPGFLSILITCVHVCPFVNFSHFWFLNTHWVNFNQTLHKASLREEDLSFYKWRTTPFSKGW